MDTTLLLTSAVLGFAAAVQMASGFGSDPALVVGALVGRAGRSLLSPDAFGLAVLVLLAATGVGAVVTALA